MDKRLWNAIHELLDAAEFSASALDRYSDYEDDPLGYAMIPNTALTAHACLVEAADSLQNLMDGIQPS